MKFIPLLSFLFLFIGIADAFSQRGVTYRELTLRNTTPAIYYDKTVLPATSGDNAFMHFRVPFDAINFKTISSFDGNQEVPEGAKFFSIVQLSVEVSKSENDSRRVVERLTWRTTVFADTFEQTKSKTDFAKGFLSANLTPGKYTHRLQLVSDNQPVRFSVNERTFKVPDFGKTEDLPILLADSVSGSSINLLNFGHTVLYAQNFSALLFLPDFNPDDESKITFHIDEMRFSRQDTSFVSSVFSRDVPKENIHSFSSVRFRQGSETGAQLQFSDDGETVGYYAILDIPNRAFKNTPFQIHVTEDGRPIAQRFYRSLWIDMPVSLLNLDIAIEMMQPIVDRDTFRELRRGSSQERERKFREFWAEVDPEPEIDFNPVMVEFFRRVDIAFDRFSSAITPGYETAMGVVFMRNGEPEHIERRFPTGSPATEIWTYPDRVFTFRATSGFGDFELISQTKRN